MIIPTAKTWKFCESTIQFTSKVTGNKAIIVRIFPAKPSNSKNENNAKNISLERNISWVFNLFPWNYEDMLSNLGTGKDRQGTFQ